MGNMNLKYRDNALTKYLKYLYGFYRYILNQLLYSVRFRALKKLFEQGMPIEFYVPFLFLLSKQMPDKETKQVTVRVEGFRKKMEKKTGTVPVFYSPKPTQDCSIINDFNFRPKHGEIKQFTMKQIAHTGKNWYWGAFFYLIARCLKAKVLLELGSCVGISACYFASSPFCKKFITIEGSQSLAKLAEENLKKINEQAIVINALFDDALDSILPHLSDCIDLCFIDGHHEKNATIHYFKRIEKHLSPGSVVIFDDISWSQDMRDAWNYLSISDTFSHTFDLGNVGLCVVGSFFSNPKNWNLQPILGKTKISFPHGWQK
jgi:predicted O-methyltransferase YrrM